MISLASRSATFLPVLLNKYAVVSPVIPPPTTQTSTSKFSSNVGYLSSVSESSQYDCASSGKDVFFIMVCLQKNNILSISVSCFGENIHDDCVRFGTFHDNGRYDFLLCLFCRVFMKTGTINFYYDRFLTLHILRELKQTFSNHF